MGTNTSQTVVETTVDYTNSETTTYELREGSSDGILFAFKNDECVGCVTAAEIVPLIEDR